jgi:hypothetical protein
MADEDAKQVPAEGEHPTTRQRQRAGPLIALLYASTHVFCHTLLPLIAPRTDLHHRGDRLFSISSEEEQQAKLEAQRRSKGKQPAEEEEDDDDEVVRRQRGSRQPQLAAPAAARGGATAPRASSARLQEFDEDEDSDDDSDDVDSDEEGERNGFGLRTGAQHGRAPVSREASPAACRDCNTPGGPVCRGRRGGRRGGRVWPSFQEAKGAAAPSAGGVPGAPSRGCLRPQG